MKPARPGAAAELRRRAEARLPGKRAQAAPAGKAIDPRRLVHELQVHQIELEIQNQELREAKAETERLAERFADFYEFSPAGFVSVNRNGLITHSNLVAARFLNTDRARLRGGRFARFVAVADRPACNTLLQQVFATHARQTSELALMDKDRPPVFVRIEATLAADGHECRMVLVNITERKQAEQQRDQLMARLDLLSSRLLESREEERRKLGYELHEKLCQDLASLGIQLRALKTVCAAMGREGDVANAILLAGSAMARARALALDLTPPELEDFGLSAALRAYCAKQAELTGLAIHADALELKVRAHRDVERACFAVLQLALNNILHHAQASEVWVSLDQGADGLTLSVRDNGIGFDVRAQRTGAMNGDLGLLSMEQRAHRANGQIAIRSSHGAGTEVCALFPLRAAPRTGQGAAGGGHSAHEERQDRGTGGARRGARRVGEKRRRAG